MSNTAINTASLINYERIVMQADPSERFEYNRIISRVEREYEPKNEIHRFRRITVRVPVEGDGEITETLSVSGSTCDTVDLHEREVISLATEGTNICGLYVALIVADAGDEEIILEAPPAPREEIMNDLRGASARLDALLNEARLAQPCR